MVRPFAFLLACLLAAVGSDAGSATAIGTVTRLQGACQGAMNGTAEDLSLELGFRWRPALSANGRSNGCIACFTVRRGSASLIDIRQNPLKMLG
jgi:hypothetical protein